MPLPRSGCWFSSQPPDEHRLYKPVCSADQSGQPWPEPLSWRRGTAGGTTMKLFTVMALSMTELSPELQRPVVRLQGGLPGPGTPVQSVSMVQAPGRPMQVDRPVSPAVRLGVRKPTRSPGLFAELNQSLRAIG